MIVVDTNVIAYLWIPGAHTPAAERVLQKDPDWHTPLLWRSEFRSVLAGCLRGGRMTVELASEAAAGAEARMRGREYAVPTDLVLRRVAASRCSAYDCEFVALADELGVPLVTADRAVLAAFPATARSLHAFAASR